MQIRPARLPDLPALAALARRTYGVAYGHEMRPEALEAHLRLQLSDEQVARMLRRDLFLLAEVEGELAGFVQVGSVHPEYRSEDGRVQPAAGDREVRRLYVLERWQGREVGSRLMEAALNGVPSAGRVFLTVWHTNHGARRFYARFGFTWIGTVPFLPPDDGFDLLLCRPGDDS